MVDGINPLGNDNSFKINEKNNSVDTSNTINESIFNHIDKNKDGIITIEEAKEYGFKYFEITNDLTKDDFRSKVKNYNDKIKTVSNKTDKKAFAEESHLDLKEENGELLLKYPELFDGYCSLNEALEKYGNDALYSLHLQNANLKDIDFNKYPEVLKRIKFGDNTFDKSCKFPTNYNPQQVMELGKNPGLNVKSMHQAGFTGQGVNIAIIDSNLNPHKNYNDNIISYEEMNGAKKAPVHFHGAAVTSIAVGKETGIAPDAKTYYMATSSDNLEKDEIQALSRILEINQNLSNEKKIRFVSISAPLYGGNKSMKIIEQLKQQGTWVMTSEEFNKNFGYLEKKNPMGNPDDFENYTPAWKNDNTLYINSGDRTVATADDENSFRHDSRCCMSWSIPYIAGLYACACQADSDMTPEKFIESAHKTAYIQKDKTEKTAQNDIMNFGYNKLLRQIAKELYPDVNFENIDQDRDKQKIILKHIEDKYGDKLNDITLDLAKEYKAQLIQDGKIDENYKYIPPQYEEIKIIDAKALMEYIQNNKNN